MSDLLDIKFRIENLENSYNDMLDELYPYNFGSYTYAGSTVLKAVDPIMYKIEFDNYVDSEIKDILEDLKNININDYNDIDLKHKITDKLDEYGY